MRTFWSYFSKAWRNIHGPRPVSFYMLGAIVVVLLLGLQIADVRENPKQCVFVLALLFVFFFVALFCALLDLMDILRRDFMARHRLLRETLGDKEFLAKMKRRSSPDRDAT